MLIEALHGLVLGAVQGLTEFFPVSSSGHLILLPNLFHWSDQGTAFDTVLHLGTLAALLWFFRADIGYLLVQSFKKDAQSRDARRFIAQLIVATIPALFFGVLFKDLLETSTRNTHLVAYGLAFWGLVLLAADRFASKHPTESAPFQHLRWSQALAVGFAQPIALLPGTSRSGITITAGLFAGLSREAAARFSFFLSIPITAAAGLNGVYELMSGKATVDASVVTLIAGFAAALVFGAWAIRFLLSYVAKKHYDAFVIYRLVLALSVLLVL